MSGRSVTGLLLPRWPLMTRRRHDREVTRLELGHTAAVNNAHVLAAADAVTPAKALVAAWLEGRADAHDLDADKLDGRTATDRRLVKKPDASSHRVVADVLRECARDCRDAEVRAQVHVGRTG